MNLPNKLTLARIIMIPFFVTFLLSNTRPDQLALTATFHWAALVLFVAATITDYYDGQLARKYGMVTTFGKLFDPLADKLLTMSAFVAFVEMRMPSGRSVFPAWAIIVILGREFLVTGLRSVAVAQGQVIGADRWGKHKTGWQLGVIIGVLSTICVRDTLLLWNIPVGLLDRWFPLLYDVALWIVIALTVISGIVFLRKNWDVVSGRE